MARIVVPRTEMEKLKEFLLNEAEKVITTALDKMDDVLFKEAGRLADKIRSSPEFQALKTPTLIGQFGFTPEEVSRLDNLFGVIAPNSSNDVTSVVKSLDGKRKSTTLQWVDFERLKFHPVADHPLTKLNPATGAFEQIGVVSWIEWWENGITIRGHIFTRGNRISLPFSRSGQGLMQSRPGSFFAIRPTRIFERIGEQSGEIQQRLEKAFIDLVEGKV